MVLMSQDVAYSCNARPLDFRPCRLEFVRKPPTRLRDDLDASLDDEAQFPFALEFRKCLADDFRLDALNGFEHVTNRMTCLAFHQNTRTADCSMSLRSIGCRLS